MADTAVHNLTEKTSLVATDEFYLVQSPYGAGDDRRTALSSIQDFLEGAVNTWTAENIFSKAGNTARFVNTTDGASVQAIRLEGDRATMADGDQAYA